MILLTGRTGLLGNNLYHYGFEHGLFFKVIPRPFGDITEPGYWTGANKQELSTVRLIVHCAAFTDLNRAEKEKDLCYKTNVIGTRNLASLGIPMIYISTEYVFDGERGNYEEEGAPNPLNYYSLTKLLGEYESRKAPRSVVIRCLFKSRPFKHDVVCNDSFTSGNYIDRIAPEIALAIKNFDKLPETIHIGTGRKSLEAIARETKPDIKVCTTGDILSVRLPKDCSLNCSKWEKIKCQLTSQK